VVHASSARKRLLLLLATKEGDLLSLLFYNLDFEITSGLGLSHLHLKNFSSEVRRIFNSGIAFPPPSTLIYLLPD